MNSILETPSFFASCKTRWYQRAGRLTDRLLPMRPLLSDAAHLSKADQDEANLPFWVVDSVTEPENDLPELQLARNRFKRRYLNSEARKSEWDLYVDRAKRLNTNQTTHHFMAISGHTMEDVLQSCGTDPCRKVGYKSGSVFTTPILRSASKTTTYLTAEMHKMHRRGSRVVVSAISVYLMLIMVGSWEPRIEPADFIHSLPEYNWLELGANPRGHIIPREMYVTRRYKVAVRKLQKAKVSVLGVFPGIKRDLLNEAIMEMEDAIRFQAVQPYVYPEALILLADAYIQAGQAEKAVPLVDEIIRRNERRAKQAREMRTRLQRMGLYP